MRRMILSSINMSPNHIIEGLEYKHTRVVLFLLPLLHVECLQCDLASVLLPSILL